MLTEPAVKNAIAFFDGQNLFRHAKDAFGHYHPNYDPIKLHQAVCAEKGWRRTQTRFYTGVPITSKDPVWAAYWNSRIIAMQRAGIITTTREIKYREKKAYNQKGEEELVTVPQEKGIDTHSLGCCLSSII